jgi:alpha-tubulin suppressor-like RCC1 family protein
LQGRCPVEQLQVYRLNLGQAVHMVACGAKHTLVSLAGGGLLAWGDNSKGQLGAPAGVYKQVLSPMRIHAFDAGFLACISAGSKHSAAIQEGGSVVCWGSGR